MFSTSIHHFFYGSEPPEISAANIKDAASKALTVGRLFI